MNQRKPQNTTTFMDSFTRAYRQTPFWCRFLYFSLLITWLLDLFTGISTSVLSSSFETTILGYQLWRLMSSCLTADGGLFVTLLIIFNMNTFLPKIERKSSSLFVCLKMLFLNMAIQLTICLINLVIIYFLPEIAYESYGVGALWFNLVYKYCYNNSLRPIKVCCFGCKINKKLYPLLLWTVLCVLQFKLRHDCLIGIIIAAQECLVCPRWTLWSVSLFRTLQKAAQMIKLSNLQCWSAFDDLKENKDLADGVLFGGLEQSQEIKYLSETNNSSQKSIDPFQHMKGLRIGDY